MRNPEYQFVDTSVDALVSLLIASYERLSGQTVQARQPGAGVHPVGGQHRGP